jgi:hypothetical protein
VRLRSGFGGAGDPSLLQELAIDDGRVVGGDQAVWDEESGHHIPRIPCLLCLYNFNVRTRRGFNDPQLTLW